jgi:oligopeptide transport system substrate-binding protein
LERLRKTWLIVLLVAALAATFGLAVGCGGDDETTTTAAGGDTTESSAGGTGEEPVVGGTFNYYINEPAFIDPVNVQESEGTKVESNVFDSLTDFDPKTSELIPAAAESWSANEDGSVWTFKLRAGATFHDGSPVTAADFKYAWERICNPDNQSEISYHLSAVQGFDEMQEGTATELSGVVAVDDTTLEVTLAYPFGDFEYVVGHPALAPVPKAAVEADPAAFAEMPVGNGPFMMAEPWAHDQYIKIVRYDGYYGDKAYLDGVDFKIFKDEETAFLEFKAGNLDFTTIPSGQIEATKAEFGESPDGLEVMPGQQVLLGPETAIYYVFLNNQEALADGTENPLSNADLRRAVSLAINRQAIADTVYEGTRQPASTIIPEGIAGYEAGAWQYSTYDAEQAKALLETAGYPGGEGLPELKLSFNTGSGHEPVMELVQADLAAIGIKTTLDGQEWAQYLDAMDANQAQMGRLGWIADYPITDNFLYPLFNSESADNHSFYKNPEVDAQIDAARKMTDTDARVAAYQEVTRLIGDDAPVVPIVNYRHRDVGSDRIHGFVYSPQGIPYLAPTWIAQ